MLIFTAQEIREALGCEVILGGSSAVCRAGWSTQLQLMPEILTRGTPQSNISGARLRPRKLEAFDRLSHWLCPPQQEMIALCSCLRWRSPMPWWIAPPAGKLISTIRMILIPMRSRKVQPTRFSRALGGSGMAGRRFKRSPGLPGGAARGGILLASMTHSAADRIL